MKSLKNRLIKEGVDVRWYPEDYHINSAEDVVEMLVDLAYAADIPEMIYEAFDEGTFDPKELTEGKKFGELFVQRFVETVLEVLDE